MGLPAAVHVFLQASKPHTARGRAPIRQRLMLAMQAHMIANNSRWLMRLHFPLLWLLYVPTKRGPQ